MKRRSSLAEIISEFGEDSEHPPTNPVAQERVKRWMKSNDIDVLGATYAFITDPKHYPRIEPPLAFADYYPFVIRYVERCLRENPDGEWADSRYLAGHSLVAWFVKFWDDPEVPRHSLHDMKRWLGGLYKAGDEELRICIVTGILEHLFERPDISDYFRDWKKDGVLEVAYKQAMKWNAG